MDYGCNCTPARILWDTKKLRRGYPKRGGFMKFTVSMFGNGKAQKRTTENPEDVHELIAKINWNEVNFVKITRKA